jgi:hypothetical protein
MLDRAVACDADRDHAVPNPGGIRTLVLKLRWIGLEQEAGELASHLAGIIPAVTLADVTKTD